MEHVIHERRSGGGTLAWIAFIAVAMVVTAVLIVTGVRHVVNGNESAGVASSTAANPRTSPAPAPLPKPRVAPNGAAIQRQDA